MALTCLLAACVALTMAMDSGEFLIDTCGVHTEWHPAVTFGGAGFLVVWEDFRAGQGDIYGTRVGQDGSLLDPAGILIAASPDEQREPAVAFDGANYFVVWEQWTGGSGSADIRGVRVDLEGRVLDSSSIAVSAAPNRQGYPKLAFDGSNYLVVWHDDRMTPREFDVYGARVSPAGYVLDTGGIVVSGEPGLQSMPAVAHDGMNSLVVWFDGRSGSYDVYACRVAPDGRPLDPDGFPISVAAYDQWAPAVARGFQHSLVAWADERNGPADIYCARVDVRGAVLDPDGVAVASGGQYRTKPAIVLDDANYLVVWQARTSVDYHLYGAKVDPDGAVSEEFPVAVFDNTQSRPAIARGAAPATLLVYNAYTYEVGGKRYAQYRVWGKLGPLPGAVGGRADDPHFEVGVTTVCQGVVSLPWSASCSRLLDASGREVLVLRPGLNDVRGLAPGVYFVSVVTPEKSFRAKVVVR